MRSWWYMNAISLGWNVTVALSGAEDEPGERGELCEQREPGESGRPSEPGESGEPSESGEPGWNVTMAVSGGKEERPSFSG